MIVDFPHTAPESYFYEFEEFNSRLIAIWLCHTFSYSYTQKSVRSIWGFYSPKKRQYYEPVNSTRAGKQVNISDTTSYTAMQPYLTPLEKCFQ